MNNFRILRAKWIDEQIEELKRRVKELEDEIRCDNEGEPSGKSDSGEQNEDRCEMCGCVS